MRKNGSPIGMPIALASSEREMTHPSFDDRTTTGLPRRSGRQSLSHETKKLLQSQRASIGYLPAMMRVELLNGMAITPRIHIFKLKI
jgi:hypothetical protein